jgi:hypothetical protein
LEDITLVKKLKPTSCITKGNESRTIFDAEGLRNYLRSNPKDQILWFDDSDGGRVPIPVEALREGLALI